MKQHTLELTPDIFEVPKHILNQSLSSEIEYFSTKMGLTKRKFRSGSIEKFESNRGNSLINMESLKNIYNFASIRQKYENTIQ